MDQMQFGDGNAFDSIWFGAGLGHDAAQAGVDFANATSAVTAVAAAAVVQQQHLQQQHLQQQHQQAFHQYNQQASKRLRAAEQHSQHQRQQNEQHQLQMQQHHLQQAAVQQHIQSQQQQQQQQRQFASQQQRLLQQRPAPSYAEHASVSSSGGNSSPERDPNPSWSDCSSGGSSSSPHATLEASTTARSYMKSSPPPPSPLSTSSAPSSSSPRKISGMPRRLLAPKTAACKADILWAEYTPATTGLHTTYSSARADAVSTPIYLTCAVDKGFKASAAEGFICQKKNHFQVSVVVCTPELPAYVAVDPARSRSSSSSGGTGANAAAAGCREKIVDFVVDMHGVKTENHARVIKLEQSCTDKLKRPYVPTPLNLDGAGDATSGGEEKCQKGKSSIMMLELPMNPSSTRFGATVGFKKLVTVGRLHFHETTSNNMRKRGKPNPDQRHFALVVKVMAKTDKGNLYPVAAMISEKLIVRASNPGHFEQDSPPTTWSKGSVANALCHDGFVGINTMTPTEALCVDGNIKVTGTVLQPSDKRVKTDIAPVDTAEQLANIQQLGLYTYQLRPEWAATVNLQNAPTQCGVIAQELQQVLPSAVREESGSRRLKDGTSIANLLTVDKERLHMEALGAIQALASKTDRLEQMVAQQEQLAAALTAELDEVVAATAAAQKRGLSDERLNGVANWASTMAASVQTTVKELAGQLPVLAAAFALVAI